MSRSKHPIYQHGVAAYLSQNTKAFVACLRNPELSRQERLLLEARGHMRTKRWNEAITTLEKITDGAQEFLKAEKCFLRATCAFFQNNLEDSAAFNLEAFHLYQACDDRRGCFQTSYNLSVDFGRFGMQKVSRKHLKIAEVFAEKADEKAVVLRALACGASKAGKYEEACAFVESLLLIFESLSLHDRYVTRCVVADIYARAGKYLLAVQQLRPAHSSRLNIDTARTFFELKLLDFLNADIAFSNLPRALTSSPEYTLKWQFLAAFQGGELERALKLWEKLRRSQPLVFGEFPCANDSEEQRDLFFQAIEKIGAKRSVQKTATAQMPAKETSLLLERLKDALTSSPMPLRKEELIEKIWDIHYSPDYDSRFYKLLERFKKTYRLRVLSERRAYRLA